MRWPKGGGRSPSISRNTIWEKKLSDEKRASIRGGLSGRLISDEAVYPSRKAKQESHFLHLKIIPGRRRMCRMSLPGVPAASSNEERREKKVT